MARPVHMYISMQLANLYQNNYQDLVNLINRRYKNKISSEDVVQDVFLEFLLRKAKRGDNPEGLLRTMVFNIAHEHNRRNFYKRGTLMRQIYLEDLSPEWDELIAAPSNEDEILYKEKIEEVHRRIAKFPKKQKAAIQYRLQGLNFKQVAKLTRRSIETAHFNFNAALRKLTLTKGL